MKEVDNSKDKENCSDEYIVWIDDLEKELEILNIDINDFNPVEVSGKELDSEKWSNSIY